MTCSLLLSQPLAPELCVVLVLMRAISPAPGRADIWAGV